MVLTSFEPWARISERLRRYFQTASLLSFCGGCGLAILCNGIWRTVAYVGGIAPIGNELRLLLYNRGVTLV